MTNLEWALNYLGCGFKIIPLHYLKAPGTCSCPKAENCGKSSGKHPHHELVPNGVLMASDDRVVIEGWWQLEPSANIGIATGQASGIIVLDVDRGSGKNGGASLQSMMADFQWTIPHTPKQRTGSGGTHYVFKAPERDVSGTQNLGGHYEHIDLKADGGYIVAAPSQNLNGGYTWEVDLNTPLAQCPEFLLRLADEKKQSQGQKLAYSSQPWDGTLPKEVELLVQSNEKLRERLSLRTPHSGGDTSHSGIDASIAGLLVKLGVTDPAVLEHALLWSWKNAGLSNRHNEKGPSYFHSTIGKLLTSQPSLGNLVTQPVQAAPPPPSAVVPSPLTKSQQVLVELRKWQRAVPPRPTLFQGLFSPGEVTILSACSGTGKSSFAIWHAAHFALGLAPHRHSEIHLNEAMTGAGYTSMVGPWHENAFALYIAPDQQADDIQHLIDRFTSPPGEDELNLLSTGRWAEGPRFRAIGRTASSMGCFDFLNFDDPDVVDTYVSVIEDVKKELNPTNPNSMRGLVVLDTMARLSGGDELDNAALTKLISKMETVGTRCKAAILVLHHVSQEMHHKTFDQIDPRTYGRGGTAAAAAARVACAMAPVSDTAGRVIGVKVTGNRMPPRGPLYWEVCPQNDAGIQYWKPISAAAVAAIQAENPGENEAKEPTGEELLAAIGKPVFTIDEAREAVCSIWPKKDGTTSEPNTSRVREMTTSLLDGLVQDGRVVPADGHGKKASYTVVQKEEGSCSASL